MKINKLTESKKDRYKVITGTYYDDLSAYGYYVKNEIPKANDRVHGWSWVEFPRLEDRQKISYDAEFYVDDLKWTGDHYIAIGNVEKIPELTDAERRKQTDDRIAAWTMYERQRFESLEEDASYEWKPNTSFKHIKDIYNKVKANDYKYVNNEREEFMAAVKKAERKGYKPEECRQIKEWHRDIWQHNRKTEAFEKDGGPFWYFTRHGLGPGMLPKGVNVVDTVEDDNYGTYIALDKVLSTQELKDYELKEKKPDVKEGYSHFEFTSGSNPYIAKDEKEKTRILKKYGNKAKEIKPGFYKVDDSEEERDLFRVDDLDEGSIPRNALKIRATDKMNKKSIDLYKHNKYWKDSEGEDYNLYDPAYLRKWNDIEVLETDPNYKPNRTKPEYVVQGNYGYGWEDLTASDDYSEARNDLKTYRENETGVPHRLITRRVPVTENLKEAFKPSNSGIQSVKCYNPYNYTIQELRVDNDNKTFERGNFTAGKPDKKTKNRQEYEDIVDTLKELGYTEIKSDYRSMRNKSRKGNPTSVEEGYELSPRIDYNPNHLRDDEGKIMADKWYESKWPDDEIGIEQLKGITLDDALKDRSILGHCDTQVRERVYAQLDKYIPLSVDSPIYKEKNEFKSIKESIFGMDMSNDYYVITTIEAGKRYYIRDDIDFNNPPEDAYDWFTNDINRAKQFSSRQMASEYWDARDLGDVVFGRDNDGRKVRYHDYVKSVSDIEYENMFPNRKNESKSIKESEVITEDILTTIDIGTEIDGDMIDQLKVFRKEYIFGNDSRRVRNSIYTILCEAPNGTHLMLMLPDSFFGDSSTRSVDEHLTEYTKQGYNWTAISYSRFTDSRGVRQELRASKPYKVSARDIVDKITYYQGLPVRKNSLKESINESKSINEELWDSARVIDLVNYCLDRGNPGVNTLVNLIKKRMEEEGSKLPYNITDFYDVIYRAIDNYNGQFEDELNESKSLNEFAYKTDDLKAFYNTSTTIDKEKYPNFFVWYDEMVKSGKIKVNEEFDDDVDDLTYYYEDEVFKHNLETNPYAEIESKQVPDSDGFMTDYTMYMNMNTGEYVFILGDKDVYCPDNGYFYFDWECETEEEAKEWFDNYVGFDDDLLDECWSSKLEEETETSPIVHKKSDGSYLVQSDNGDGYTAFNKDNVCQGHISASNELEAKNKFNSNKFDE